MRKSCFALKALCGAPSLWIGGVLSFLFVLPCQSQVATYKNSNNSPAVSERSSGNRTADSEASYLNGNWNNNSDSAAQSNVNTEKPYITSQYGSNAQTVDESANHVDNIDNVRQLIDASLPIVKKLSSQNKPFKDTDGIKSLMSIMNLKVNGKSFGYYDIPEMLRRSFTKYDFQGFYYVLLSVDKSLSDLQNTQMDNSDIRYVMAMEEISQELFRSNFIGRISPLMIIKAYKEAANSTLSVDDVVISIYDEIDLLNNNRYVDFQPKNIEELNAITNQKVLANVANKHKDAQLRIAAVNRLTSETDIYNVARNDGNSQVRLAAVRKLNSETYLYNVARNDGDSQIRFAAVNRLTSETYLYNVARNDGNSQVRLAAVRKLTSETFLYNVARNDGDSQIRLLAINILTSETYLYNIARNDGDSRVRFAAVSKMTTDIYLNNIANNDSDPQVRQLAINRMNNKTSIGPVVYDKNDE